MSSNVNPLDTTKRQVTYSTGQLRDCCLRSSYDFPQRPKHCSPNKYARVSRCSHGDVVMLFCSSFTQSERFLQLDQLIIRRRSCSHDKLHSHGAISSDSPELKQTTFCFLEDAYMGYHVFSTEPLTQTAIPE